MILLAFVMSFAALLRGPVAVGGQQVKTTRRQYKYDKRSVEASLETGQRIVTFMESTYGHERSTQMLEKVARRASGSQPSPATDVVFVDVAADDASGGADADDSGQLPYGFWRRFMEDEMQSQFTQRKKMQFIRALRFYVERKNTGASTSSAMRGMRDPGSCRSDGGAANSQKATGLGFMLLQYFVDHVKRLRCRADSDMLMEKAREYRAELVHSGWRDVDLPKLIGNAGHKWFQRWRESYNLVKKVTGMKLKTPWSSIKKRIRVFLNNIFRLRAFWEIIHPDTPMRFISLDQKPSWFNNAGHTGTFAQRGGRAPTVRENFNQTRERYSILTCVPSWGHGASGSQPSSSQVPPKIAILFKGSATGSVKRQLRKCKHLKSWMLVQTQEHGSYRSEDMVEALDFLLPPANDSTESIIVLLDWYSGHLTDEVAALVRAKGHVLVFHGGGCTPFTQVNDTHLHALLARLLIQIENQWALEERTRLLKEGKNKTPKMTREEILSIVQNAWLMINHERVAQKGYKQTGPGMPMTGPIAPEDVFGDLLTVLEIIDPSPTPLAVGTVLRDEAVAFVKAEYEAGRLTSWADCHKLIEDQDGVGEAVVEGMEAYSYKPDDEQDEEEEEDTDGEDDDETPPPPPPGSQPSGPSDADNGLGDDNQHSDSDITGDEEPDGSSGGAGGVVIIDGPEAADSSKADGESAEAAESKRAVQVVAARQIMYQDAVRTKNDVLLRHLRQQMRSESKQEREIATDIGMLLRKRALESSEADAKLRRESMEEERLSAKQLADTQKITAQAKQAKEEARLACLQQMIVNRRDIQAKRHGEAVEKAFQKYLQTQYPAILGRECIDWFIHLPKGQKKKFEQHIEALKKNHTFERQLFIPDLWEDDRNLTREWQHTTPFLGGARRAVRCGLPFQVTEKPYMYPQRALSLGSPIKTYTNTYRIYLKYQAAAGPALPKPRAARAQGRPGRGPGLGPGRAGRRLVFRIYILYVFVHVLIGLPRDRARSGYM